MQAQILPFKDIVLPEEDAPRRDPHLDGFQKALLILKTFLKSSGLEIVVGVNNLHAAELLTADEVRALADFYGWEMPQ
jgi:hypothetical protein